MPGLLCGSHLLSTHKASIECAAWLTERAGTYVPIKNDLGANVDIEAVKSRMSSDYSVFGGAQAIREEDESGEQELKGQVSDQQGEKS